MARLLRRLGVLFGISFLLASCALLLLAGQEDPPSLAAEGPAGGPAAWTPAPLLALLLVAAMSGLILLVSLKPRRG